MISAVITHRPAHVWVDGRLLPADGPHLSAFDRGFQLGDRVFETLRALDGPEADASIRITVSRGPIVARGLLPHGEVPPPTVVVQAWPVVPPPPDHLERGLHVVASALRRDPENPPGALKTTSRAA